MTDQIVINKKEAEAHTEELMTAARYFQEAPLNFMDNRSTISGNKCAQEAYDNGQKAIARFGKALEQEAGQIKSLNLAFQELDEMMAKLLEQGMRYSTITAVDLIGP